MTKTLSVEGMMCQHCAAHVKKALEAIPGVTAEVKLETKQAVVTLTQPVEDAALEQAVTAAGYPAKVAG